MIDERKIVMNQNEIKQHEHYKQMAIYSYDVNKNKLPQGANLIGIAQKVILTIDLNKINT